MWLSSRSTTRSVPSHRCYHLAAAVGVDLIVERPLRTIETNVHCTEVVLAAASKKRTPILIASASEVYGKSAALPFREDGRPRASALRAAP